jgi:hypothetical protein
VSRLGVGVVYLAGGVWIFARDRQRLHRLLRDGFRASYAELSATDVEPRAVSSQTIGPESAG